ncbi:hydantoinase/oxoprolinase family protein (plasmid) [Mesorhizobium sp. ORM8.1]
MERWQVGVDVGGTFTDVVAVDPKSNAFRIGKVPSTLDNQAKGVLNALQSIDVPLSSVASIVHGTTVGTNAVLERKGVACGMITTQGMRDVIELGRRTRPNNYGMTGFFEALIPRENRIEVPERMGADGRPVVPLDEAKFIEAVETLKRKGVPALVIHFLHSYANPEHERRAAEIARGIWPNEFVSVGHEILPEVREFERGSTVAINGYIQPLMHQYLSSLENQLHEGGYSGDLLVMQGNSGTITAKGASQSAAQTVMSGPAAGALAAARISMDAGIPNIIGCDMGGTSFEVVLIRNGEPNISAEKDVAYSVPIRVPMIDIHTIGAGGGSIARVNGAGILQVGPESAGSWPGPVCYNRGGTEPTVTDANLMLGRLDVDSIAGINRSAPMESVKAALLEKIGEPLGMDVLEAAQAVISVAVNHLAAAIRLMTIERGEDPRDFAIFAFGGAGPVHAVGLAAELGIPKVLVPRFPGANSALGCTLADLRHDYVQTIGKPLLEIADADIDAIFAAHFAQGKELIRAGGVDVLDITATYEADLLFKGQTHTFRMRIDSPGLDRRKVLDDFMRQYRQRFDVELTDMVPVLANARTTVRGVRPTLGLDLFRPASDLALPTEKAIRDVFFDGSFHKTKIFRRELLPVGYCVAGPAIIEQFDTTIVVDPGASATVDAHGNLVITVGEKP